LLHRRIIPIIDFPTFGKLLASGLVIDLVAAVVAKKQAKNKAKAVIWWW
jgi:hypothetical protein